MFGQSYSMNLDGDSNVVQTYVGSLCSILILAISFIYAFQKLLVLIGKKDVTVLSTTIDSMYDDSFIFDYKHGFNLAVAFTGYNDITEYELDPSYGELVFKAMQWGPHPDGTFYDRSPTLTHHACKEAELGISDSQDF